VLLPTPLVSDVLAMVLGERGLVPKQSLVPVPINICTKNTHMPRQLQRQGQQVSLKDTLLAGAAAAHVIDAQSAYLVLLALFDPAPQFLVEVK
jgi:hypothetical protein